MITIAICICLIIKLNKKKEISYDDGIVGKNYFKEITIDMKSKTVKRDNKETSLKEEFDISEEQENTAFSSIDEMKNLLSNSVFDITAENQKITIKNPYQTKSIIVKSKNIKEKVEKEEITQITDELYVLSFYSEKLTKAMYNFYKEKEYIEKIFYDEISINQTINDISQTLYGGTEINLHNHHSLGATVLGLDKYAEIINANGNPADVVIATIGYGINYENEFFKDRINENYYNFVLNDKNIAETTAQGSRIAEVLVDSTTANVKIMPLVTVTKEGYTSLSSIIKALAYAKERSDVICYELINNKNEVLDMALEECFKENVAVCSVSANNLYTDNTENKNDTTSTGSEVEYPANHAMTIAVSSLDREMKIADYSGRGQYIDFAIPSTDVEEIFSNSANISRWSGAEYSNAQITAIIALIKTYSKDATILEMYNFIRNFTEDLGEEGKDELYGYGCPKFQDLTIMDIDKKSPEFKEITYENETWETSKQVKIVANDNIRMSCWAITKNENGPDEGEWKEIQSVTPNLDVTFTISENGKFYIWIKDVAGNTETKEIQIDKVDNTPPQISYTINKDTLSEGYVTINVTAQDNQSGLYDSPFSWDKKTWSQENSTRTIKENGRYKVYAEDNLGNVAELEILVDCFPIEGRFELGDGNIITDVKVSSDWIGNTNNSVEITLNKELDIIGWQIGTSETVPNEFVAVEPEEGATTTINQNSSTQNNTNTNQINIDLPSNVVVNGLGNTNTSEPLEDNNQEQIQPRQPRINSVVLKTSLDINTTYYFWIKDSYANASYQTLKIYKAEI